MNETKICKEKPFQIKCISNNKKCQRETENIEKTIECICGEFNIPLSKTYEIIDNFEYVVFNIG